MHGFARAQFSLRADLGSQNKSQGAYNLPKNQICLWQTALDARHRHGEAKWESILIPKTDPNKSPIDPKSSSDVVKNEIIEIVDFSYPTLARSLFLGSNGS